MEVQIGTKLSLVDAFRLAIAEGKKGYGFVSPNPAVGCVFLDKNFGFISKGFHQRYGGPHAEVEAYNGLINSSLLEGGHAVVTLEPCAHFGKTPPCAELLAKLPLKEVHYGIKDPNPLVSGKGLDILSRAGIAVTQAPDEVRGELEDLCEVFLVNQNFKECFVALKLASSLDGMMCLPGGESQWITSQVAREQGHFLRAKYGAVLSTAKSVMKDDSQLNSRVEPFLNKKIPVAILDEQGELPSFLPKSSLLRVRSAEQIYIFTPQEHFPKFKALRSLQLKVLEIKNEKPDLKSVFRSFYEMKWPSVFVEAGPSLTSALMEQDLYHRLELFIGNKFLGSNTLGSWTKGLSPSSMAEVKGLIRPQVQTLGEDIFISGRNSSSFKPLFL